MKPLNRIFLIPAAVVGLSMAVQAQTVSSGVPGFISYQGKVLDANGTAVGVGAPINRTVTFRIWDHPSNTTLANLIYSEEQTVTIADGEFSVLVGQGVVTSAPIADPETAQGPPLMKIADAFNGDARYLGVTISDGDGNTVDNEISPRQQIVSSAFAFRAKYAETLGTSTKTALTVLDSGNVGIGNVAPNAPLMVSGANATTSAPQFIVSDSADPNERLRIGVNSSGNGSGFIQSFKEGLGAQNLLLNPNGGNVGIGTSTPNGPLDVNGYLRVSSESGSNGLIALGNRANGAGYYDNGMFRGGIGSLAAANYTNIGSHSGIAFNSSAATLGSQSTRMFINGADGRVGIGTTAPGARLHVIGVGSENTLLLQKEGQNSCHFYNGGNGDHYLRSGLATGGIFMQDTGGAVGIGTATPGATKLNVVAEAAFTQSAQFLRTGLPNGIHLHNGTNGDHYLRSGSAAGAIFLQDTGGRVGVGTLAPLAKMHINSPASEDSLVLKKDGQANHTHFNSGANGNHYLRSGSSAGSIFMQDTGGNVSIGNTDASGARLTVIGGPVRSGMVGAYINGANVGNAVVHGSHFVSIYASQTIWSGNTVIASSDARIKDIQGESDSEADLKALLGIKITDYQYKDKIGQGSAKQKKVVAQELESVFPQAVSRHTNVIPDIYEKATIGSDGWVALTTDLKVGDRVRLIATEKDAVFEVLEVENDSFRVEFIPKEEGELFVYGREVKDFRTVDYDAIAMLNVSATQQIKKDADAEIGALRIENQSLRLRLTAFEAADKAREARVVALETADKARFAAIEKLLQDSQAASAAKK